MRGVSAGLLGCVLAVVGCGDDDDDFDASPTAVGGTYALQLVNGPDSCGFGGWKEGESTGNVPLTVTQNDTALVGQVGQSGASFVLGLLLGTATFKGEIHGGALKLTALGDRRKQKSCEVQWQVALDAQTTDAGFNGTLTFTPQIDLPDNADCQPLVGCSATQTLAAVRTTTP